MASQYSPSPNLEGTLMNTHKANYAFYLEKQDTFELVENITEYEARKLYNGATKTLNPGELAGYTQMDQELLSYKVLKNKHQKSGNLHYYGA